MSYASLSIRNVESIVSNEPSGSIGEGLSKASNQSFRLDKVTFAKAIELLVETLSRKRTMAAIAAWVVKYILPLNTQTYTRLNNFITSVMQEDLLTSTVSDIGKMKGDYMKKLEPLVMTLRDDVTVTRDLYLEGATYEQVGIASRTLVNKIANALELHQTTPVPFMPNRFGQFDGACLDHLVSLQNVSSMIVNLNISGDEPIEIKSISTQNASDNDLLFQHHVKLLEGMEINSELTHCLDGYGLLLGDIEAWNSSLKIHALSPPQLYTTGLDQSVTLVTQQLADMELVINQYLHGDRSVRSLYEKLQSYAVDDANVVSVASELHNEFVQQARAGIEQFRGTVVPFYTNLLSYYNQLQWYITYVNFEFEARVFRLWRNPQDTPKEVQFYTYYLV